MTFILSIETATPLCSVALHEDGHLCHTSESQEEGVHGKKLTRLIEQTLDRSGKRAKDLAGIAISNGPGSYTGLRIGLATAKGLCFGLDIPLITLNTLEIMAASWGKTRPDAHLLPMIDARRMEVYTALFDVVNDKIRMETQALVLEPESLQTYQHKMIAFGNGALKWQASCQNEQIEFSNLHPYPEAKNMGALAFKQFQTNTFAPLVTIEPNYLKEFMGTKPNATKI
jgi:tRNA threonylcarbamoyladenosine biosynthesis protein TsaB